MTCTSERRCYQDGCATCDALPCHHLAFPSERKWQSTSQIGPGFHYWTIDAPVVGSLGWFRSPSDAAKVAAAYRDPGATRASIRAARRGAS